MTRSWSTMGRPRVWAMGIFLALLPRLLPGDSARPVDLVLKPTKEPRTYRFRVAEITRNLPHGPSGDSPATMTEAEAARHADHRVETESMVEYRTSPADALSLDIETKILQSRLAIDGTPSPESLVGTTGRKRVSIKGYKVEAGKTASDFEKFDFVLPLAPVAVGGSWTYTAPPTEDLPVFLETRFTLDEITQVGDDPVAVISGRTRVDETLAARHLRVRIDADSRVLFAIQAGHVIRSEFTIRLLTEPADPAGVRFEKRTYSSRELMGRGKG